MKSYPRCPPRLTWLFEKTRPFYFVTFNTHERQRILDRPEAHEAFKAFALTAMDHGVAVGRYVIMPDHIHLFVAIADTGITLPAWTRALKTSLGKILLSLGHQKPHWQRGFFDHVLRNSESYAAKWDYVRVNPARAGLCKIPDDWPFQGEIVRLEL